MSLRKDLHDQSSGEGLAPVDERYSNILGSCPREAIELCGRLTIASFYYLAEFLEQAREGIHRQQARLRNWLGSWTSHQQRQAQDAAYTICPERIRTRGAWVMSLANGINRCSKYESWLASDRVLISSRFTATVSSDI